MVAMPQQLVAIPEQLKAYYNDFSCPDQVYGIAQSAIFSGALSALLTRNLGTAAFTGALAAAVSTISCFTNPLMRNLLSLPSGSEDAWYTKAALRVVNIGLTQVLANAILPQRVNLLNTAVLTLSVGAAIDHFIGSEDNLYVIV